MTEDTTRRDELARERTVLANERTLLSYIRTALGLVALSVFAFKFADQESAIVIALVALLGALLVFCIGLYSFRQSSARIDGTIHEHAHSVWSTLAAFAFIKQKDTSPHHEHE
ncbi:DUF202 domain-containing protein [Candidatus Kaiserbacteria bacterium]|nr:DUF202 domain-containing protein [Candidatus Kaiserbacteria bacterium]